ncbi:MAG: hypothetical protein Q9225_000313 [Loekoesia sp. 1 TL-2023]
MEVLLFGDQTDLDHEFLQESLHRTRKSPAVAAFLDGTAAILREEIASLHQANREDIPSFTTIQELIARYSEEATAHPAIEASLTCISQFIHFLGYHEDPSVRTYPARETHVVGLCIGSLTAAAVSASNSLVDLLPLALETVAIAFRIGVQVLETARHIEVSTSKSESWSIVFRGIDQLLANHNLEDFSRDQGLSKLSNPYVSAVGPNTVTISGPPSMLERLLLKSSTFRKGAGLNLPLHAPYHAAALFKKVDAHRLVTGFRSNTLETLERYYPSLALLSTTSGKPFAAKTALELLTQIVQEILKETLRWDLVLASCVSKLENSGFCQTSVLAFGPTKAANSLRSALQAKSDSQISLQDASSWVSKDQSGSSDFLGVPRNSKLAIVGLAGRFPGGADYEAFWEMLERGLDVHKEIPGDRFDIKSHVDPDGKKRNTSHTPYGCFVDNPGHFDPRFFNMSPREAAQTDPMQRLALVTAYEALEMAGYVPNRTASSTLDRVGTFYGQTSDDYREINASQNVDTYFITGGIRAFGPGRINYHFKFSGPSFNVDTACSSSLAAIQLACTSLWSGDCDMAVAGGLSILTSPDLYAGLSRGQFLSKTGSCKTFDNAADGYCRGDSIGTVIIKRLDDAILDRDRILGVILGAATNHSANAISITHPHAQTQEHLYRKVLAQGGVDALDVDYVEMHGTGTQAGDGAEMQSISNVFAPEMGGRNNDNPLYVGSVKANVGHGEAVSTQGIELKDSRLTPFSQASGVTALIKSLLMLQKNSIPPHTGIKGLVNQTFPDLDKRKIGSIRIAMSKTPFKSRPDKTRRLLVNNFSAAGGNTALLLEEYVSSNDALPDPRPSHIVAISAKSTHSLKQNVEQLVKYLTSHSQTSLPDLAYTTTARRIHHSLRVAATGTSLQRIKEGLQSSLNSVSTIASPKPSKIAFAFTGQGSYYTGLGRDLYETSPHFRTQISHFDFLSQSHGLPSILPLLDKRLDEARAASPVQVQIFLVCVQMALCSLWSSWGIVPEIVVGHSLGEYAALNAAGVLCSSDVIFLVGHRARLLEETCSVGTHSMLAVRGQASTVQKIRNESGWELEVACINGPNDVVLSGEFGQVEFAYTDLVRRAYKCKRLDVPFAFHSSQVDPILEPFEQLSRSVNFHKPNIPVVSPLLGDVIEEAEIVTPRYLCQHARGTVDFDSALRKAQHRELIGDHHVWLEIGPHPICLGMIKAASDPDLLVPSLRKEEGAWETLANSAKELHVRGMNLDWSEYHRDYSAGLQLLNLPAYAFENKNYWLDYKNNWSLTKGDSDAGHREDPTPRFSTTTLQRIVSEEFHDGRSSVVFESDLSEPLLHTAVIGHLVNDSGLCPSSIYGDMAMSAAKYIHQRQFPSLPEPGLNVKDMGVSKPVIVSVDGTRTPQLLQVTATADFASKRVDIEFNSVDGRSSSKVSNAHCVVVYEDAAEWSRHWRRSAYLIESRIKALEVEAAGGSAQRILRGMAYKLFSALVQYAEKYRGMDEVLLLSSEREATAKVKFQADDKDGTFHFSPYWIDSLAHLSGFVLNANDAVDSKSQVFISHGWGSLRFAGQFSAEKMYRTYVKMQPEGSSAVMAGDVYVFENSVIVGLIEGLKFQQVPRTVLDHLLPPAGRPTNVKKAVAPVIPAVSAKVTKKALPSSPNLAHSEVIASLKVSAGSSIADRVEEIIAAEVGIAAHELSEGSKFAELGIDSLLSLTIIGRLREELGLGLSSTLFSEHETHGSLRAYLLKINAVSHSEPEAQKTIITPAIIRRESPDTTPSKTPSTGSGTPSETDSSETTHCNEAKDSIRTIIADEMGLSLDEISSETPLGSLGMDSLMSLTIIGAIQEKIGLIVPSQLLANNPSISELEEKLNPPEKSAMAAAIMSKDDGLHDSVAPYYPPASSILLQGDANGSGRKFFLFPDGSGSATSYAPLPTLSDGLAVFGLNSPFLKSSRDWTCGISGGAQIYITEIKRRQPRGPYLLGGWSAGGIIAYEAAYQLIQSGDTVEHLLLIDSPCPLLFPPLPASLVRFFDNLGLFGQGESPPWLLEHFDASVANLHRYKPRALDVSKAPTTFAIWAQEGVCKDPSEPRPDLRGEENSSTGWILDNRTDLGPNGWDILVGHGKVSGVGVPGNHFTMMQEPNVAQLGQQIGYTLTQGIRRSFNSQIQERITSLHRVSPYFHTENCLSCKK